MSRAFEFAEPGWLLLLPLALVPLLSTARGTLLFSWLAWLPRDRLGNVIGWVVRAVGALAIVSIVLALAKPGRPETQVPRIGRGAEILVLMDRSRSMDEHMLPSDWESIDPLKRLYHTSRGPQKAKVARDVLSRFVEERAHDRFSLVFFSTRPLQVMPFTQHDAAVQAAIQAGGVGRGLAETDVGRALISAIGAYDKRAYTGSRIILLVSDGGSQLTDSTRELIKAGLLRNRIALYWIYLRSYNSPPLDTQDESYGALGAVALHRFFGTLETPYHLYQADAEDDLAQAIEEVGRQQNLPLEFLDRRPREDYSRYFLVGGALSCLLLMFHRLALLRSWQ